jgi:IPT/TIG domain
LPAGVDVDVMDFDTFSGNDQLATGKTDSGGRVFFNRPSLADPDESQPDIFFLVHTAGRSHAGHTLPSEWSTRGWRAADGSPGSIDDYTGTPIGSLPGAPRVFRIGLDFHARITYLNARTGKDENAPKNILLKLFVNVFSNKSFFTDEDGEVHGVIFDIDPGKNLAFGVFFEMTDSSPDVNIPTAEVHIGSWNSSSPDGETAKAFTSNDRTSIGTHASPEVLRFAKGERNSALYFLKVLREFSIFFTRITNGAWKGVKGLTFSRTSISGVAFSFPIGQLNIPPKDHFDRGTLIHELSHQIMWQEVNFSSLGIAYEFIFGNLIGFHQVNLLTNTEHALIEGWAEFVEAIFDGISTPPHNVSSLEDRNGKTGIPLGPPPSNRGESVEGAFADGLWAIFQNHVVTSAVAANAHVPESPNGNIMTTTAASYLRDAGVRTRFLSMIWNPLKDMQSLSSPITTAMLSNIRTRNLSVWHVLQSELQAFNMAMDVPTLTSIDPHAGPPGGGTTVDIRGTNFTLGGMQVTIRGVPATTVIVTASNTLTAVTPAGLLGPADVVVSTPAGNSQPLAGGFTYAQPPVVSDVRETGGPTGPASGPTTGGTPVTITGTDFLPGAEVFFGGLPAAGGVPSVNVTVLLATEIQAESPLFALPQHSPGSVAVVVRNPDGQSGSLNPGFVYFLLPAPLVIRLNPVTGPAVGGTKIVIDGTNFQAGLSVLLDGRVAAIDIGKTTATQIVATTPGLPAIALPGPVLLQVVNPDGQDDRIPGGFIYTP